MMSPRLSEEGVEVESGWLNWAWTLLFCPPPLSKFIVPALLVFVGLRGGGREEG